MKDTKEAKRDIATSMDMIESLSNSYFKIPLKWYRTDRLSDLKHICNLCWLMCCMQYNIEVTRVYDLI